MEVERKITKEDGSEEIVVCREFDVEQAGGFIVQLMPFASEETIAQLENNIKDILRIEKDRRNMNLSRLFCFFGCVCLFVLCCF